MRKVRFFNNEIWDNLGYLRGKLGINTLVCACVFLWLSTFSFSAQADLSSIELMLWGDVPPTLQLDEFAQNVDGLLNDYGYTLHLTFELSGLDDKWVLDVTAPDDWQLFIPHERAAPLQRLSSVLYSWHDNQSVFDVGFSYEMIASILLYGEGVCVEEIDSPLSQDAFFRQIVRYWVVWLMMPSIY